MTPANPDYPVDLEIEYPGHLSRLLIFVKWLLAVPHYIVLFILGIAAWFVWLFSFFAIIVTGRYPAGAYQFMVGVLRWANRVSAYVFLMTDSYPPFSLEDDPSFPVRLEVQYPPTIARWRPLVQWLLVIPAMIAAVCIYFVAYFAVLIAWFAILFTARYPLPLFNTVLIAHRWAARVNVFSYWMTESYPPFVWA